MVPETGVFLAVFKRLGGLARGGRKSKGEVLMTFSTDVSL